MTILNEEEIRRTIVRLSMEAVERNKGTEDLVLVGIRTRGVILARRMRREIERIEGAALPLGILDISLYRDDLLSGSCDAVFKGSEMDFSVDGKNVALCDDVLYTGRTVRAAMEAIAEMGRPRSIQLAVLIDRGGRELPIGANYVGKVLPTSRSELVCVNVKEIDGKTGVDIYSVD